MNINRTVYDIIGIGIGPFNLGMAALCDEVPQLNCIFFDQSPSFEWHPGMMLPNARLQVPFYADLVTPVNPCSRYSFLNYLKENKKLFRFAIHENNFVTRREYNAYCKWVAGELSCLYFNHRVEDVHYDVSQDIYTVMVHNLASDSLLFYYAKHLVIGIGSVPQLPNCVEGLANLTLNSSTSHGLRRPFPTGEGSRNAIEPGATNKEPLVIHSANYLHYKDSILESANVTIVGSGQSAAEIFYDLLGHADHIEQLSWFTRSSRFYPMEYSKLSLEMSSPDYIDHFYSLPAYNKYAVLRSHDQLYKGINYSLINEIYDALYLRSLENKTSNITLHTNTSLENTRIAGDELELQFYHVEKEKDFIHSTKALILATGYKPALPHFLESIKMQIQWIEEGLLNVARNYSIDVSGKQVFVQNAELHTHGFSAPDLGMGPYRNAVILNSILDCEHFVLEKQIAFQSFGLASAAAPS